MGVQSVDSGKDGITVTLSSGRVLAFKTADLTAQQKQATPAQATAFLQTKLDDLRAADKLDWFFLPIVRSVVPLVVDLYDGPAPFTHGLQH